MKQFKRYSDIPLTIGSKAQWLARGYVVCKWAKPVGKAHLVMPGFIHTYDLYGIEDCIATNSKIGQRKREKYWATLPARKVRSYDE
jgi:hypothetical protein